MQVSGASGDNFAYLCTRVRVKRLKLYRPEEIRRMIDMDLREILRHMHEGTYKEDVDALAMLYRFSTSDVIEGALNRNLGRAYTEIYHDAYGGARARIAVFLRSIDVWNMKTFLRGVHSNTEKKEVLKNMLSGGNIRWEFWEGALDASDISAYFKNTEFAKIVSMYLADKNLASVEDTLDKEYYHTLVNFVRKYQETRADKILLEYVRKEIDIRNIQTVMKLMVYAQGNKIESSLIENVFIPDGWSINLVKFKKMCESKDYEELTQNMSGMWFENYMKEIFQVCSMEHCGGYIRKLEKVLLRVAENFAVIYPISILPVLSYLLRKKTEVEEIRTIARGKAHGLTSDEIKLLLGW